MRQAHAEPVFFFCFCVCLFFFLSVFVLQDVVLFSKQCLNSEVPPHADSGALTSCSLCVCCTEPCVFEVSDASQHVDCESMGDTGMSEL